MGLFGFCRTACAFAVGLLLVPIVQAQTPSYWQGPAPGVQGKWETAGNWLNSLAPRSGAGAYVGNGDVSDPKVVGSALIDDDTGTAQTGTLIIGAGTFVSGNGQDNGTLTMNGGTLIVDSVRAIASANQSFAIGGEGATPGGGAGTFIMNAGTVSITADAAGAALGYRYRTSVPTATGYMEMHDGLFQMTGDKPVFTVGLRGEGTVLQSGGTVNLNNGSLDISRAAGTGTYIMSGGTLITSGKIVLSTATGGAGTFIVRGGTVIVGSANLSNVAGGAGTFIVSQDDPAHPTELLLGNYGFNDGSVHSEFNGGTYTVGNFAFDPNFNAGTLSPGTSNVVGGGADFGTTTFSAFVASTFVLRSNAHLHIDLGDNPTNDPNTPNRDFIHVMLVTGGTKHLGEAGTATLDGIIDVDITNPMYQALYTILTVDLATAGTQGTPLTDHSTIVSHTPGWTFEKVYADDGRSLQLMAIPEPSMIGLAGMVIAPLFTGRPKQRGRRRISIG
jgi:hypothetical protein